MRRWALIFGLHERNRMVLRVSEGAKKLPSLRVRLRPGFLGLLVH